MHPPSAMPRPPSTAPRRRHLLRAAAAAAITVALFPTAPGGAVEQHLPDEDRLAIALSEVGTDPRLYDLLPPVAEESDGEVDGAGPETAMEEGEDPVHVLAAGESLADVAALHDLPGDDGWRRLYDANPSIDDPDLVETGTVIRIPAPEESLERRELPAPPPPRPGASTSRSGAGAGVWDRLAGCEAGGDWTANTGNGYYGGLQFTASSWRAVGGTGLPHEHGRSTQIAMGERLRAMQGWGAWPACSRKLGLR